MASPPSIVLGVRPNLVVIGAGIVGLSVAFEALRRGADILCFDPEPGEQQSAGDGRIFRLAHESSVAVRLAVAARRGWTQWEQLFQTELISDNGLVVIGDEAAVFGRAMKAAEAAFIWGDDDALPPSVPPGIGVGEPVLLDPAGGSIHATATLQKLITTLGARLIRDAVIDLGFEGDVVEVRTKGRTIAADHVVIATGTSLPELSHVIGLDLAQSTFRHARATVARPDHFEARTACFLDRRRRLGSGWSFYGLPLSGDRLALGTGWAETPFPSAQSSLADVRDRSWKEVWTWLDNSAPGTTSEPLGFVDCMYPRIEGRFDRPYEVFQKGRASAVFGHDLFKFAPVIATDVCSRLPFLTSPEDQVHVVQS